MILDLKQVFEFEGFIKEVDILVDLSEYDLFGGKPFANPIKIIGKISNTTRIVSFCYKIISVVSLQCDRCGISYLYPLDLEMEQILVKSLNDENFDYFVCENSKLDLDELITTDILLNLPTKSLCSEDCKGICLKCGTLLNESQCTCEKTAKDPRFDILSQLLN